MAHLLQKFISLQTGYNPSDGDIVMYIGEDEKLGDEGYSVNIGEKVEIRTTTTESADKIVFQIKSQAAAWLFCFMRAEKFVENFGRMWKKMENYFYFCR